MTVRAYDAGIDRRLAWVMFAVSGGAFVILAWWLVPWGMGPDTAGVRAEDYFTSAELSAAEAYAGTVRPLGWASYAVSLAVALVLGLSRRGIGLVERFGGRRWWIAVPVGVLLVLAIGRITTLPFGLAVRDERLEVGLTEQGLGGWIVDRGMSLLVSWVMTSLVLLVVVALGRRSRRRWFAWAGAVVVALVFAGSYAYPVVVEPLFNRFEPLADEDLRSAVLAVADREGVAVDEVLIADASRRTTTLNAYVSGLGETRRVVLYDNLLDQPSDQVLAVVAHELAHVTHDDVLVGTTLGAMGALFGVSLAALVLDSWTRRRRTGVRDVGDPRAVPLLLALVAVGGLLASPAENAISRAIETRADATALAETGDPDTFVEMQRQLALRSLADPTPPTWSHLWFGSHPTVLERIALARQIQEAS